MTSKIIDFIKEKNRRDFKKIISENNLFCERSRAIINEDIDLLINNGIDFYSIEHCLLFVSKAREIYKNCYSRFKITCDQKRKLATLFFIATDSCENSEKMIESIDIIEFPAAKAQYPDGMLEKVIIKLNQQNLAQYEYRRFERAIKD